MPVNLCSEQFYLSCTKHSVHNNCLANWLFDMKLLIYLQTNSSPYSPVSVNIFPPVAPECWAWFWRLISFFSFSFPLCVYLNYVLGLDWLVKHHPAGQHSSLAASEGAEWKYWAQQSTPRCSRPTWVRSGSWSGTRPRPGPYVRAWNGAWTWYGTGSSTRTGRWKSWFT